MHLKPTDAEFHERNQKAHPNVPPSKRPETSNASPLRSRSQYPWCTNNDRFWPLALAAYAADQVPD